MFGNGAIESLYTSQVVHQDITVQQWVNSTVPIYTPGWRDAPGEQLFVNVPKNITQCSQPGIEPESLNLETGALTMRSLRLQGHDK